MFYGDGVTPLTSTQAEFTNPSTSDLIAQISSLANANYEARLVLGASTIATWVIEQCLSTGLGSTALQQGSDGKLGRVTLYTPTNQSAQYMLRFHAQAGDLIRARVGTGIAAGVASATIQLEPLV